MIISTTLLTYFYLNFTTTTFPLQPFFSIKNRTIKTISSSGVQGSGAARRTAGLTTIGVERREKQFFSPETTPGGKLAEINALPPSTAASNAEIHARNRSNQ